MKKSAKYLRVKNSSTSPLPDNGLYVDNNSAYYNTVIQKQYYYWPSPTDATQAVIYNQSLGYTDVGTDRPINTPL
jgi:hypothetical protein